MRTSAIEPAPAAAFSVRMRGLMMQQIPKFVPVALDLSKPLSLSRSAGERLAMKADR